MQINAAWPGLRLLVAFMLSATLLVGAAGVAAAPVAPPDPVAAIKSLVPGQHLTLGNATIVKTVEGLVVNVAADKPVIHTAATVCGAALAAALIGIGAGVLGFIAAATGPGTVVIAGYLLTGSQVGMLAAVSGSYAALLGFISRYIC